MKILFASSECSPFAASGGLADVAGSLPAALQKEGAECRVIMPLYSSIGLQWRSNMTFLTSFGVPLSWRAVLLFGYRSVLLAGGGHLRLL